MGAEKTEMVSEEETEVEAEPSVELPKGMRFVSRKEWGAKAPRSVKLLKHPMGHVCFSYNIATQTCKNDEECFAVLRERQDHFMNGGLSDIPYNFLVGGDGTVYEGRGWRVSSSSAINNSPMSSRLDIAFIGNFERNTVPRNMYYSGIDWVYHGVRQKLILNNYSFQEIRYPLRVRNTAQQVQSPTPEWIKQQLANY